MKNKKFNAITFVHSFHHIGNIRQALRQSRKVLQENGQLIITEYSPDGGKEKDSCKRFTIKFIVDLLIKSNFRKINIE